MRDTFKTELCANGEFMVCSDYENVFTSSDSNALVGYVPAIFYANMFTVFFLEIKERTKKGKTKNVEDHKIGFKVIMVIFFFYMLLYLPVLTTIMSK